MHTSSITDDEASQVLGAGLQLDRWVQSLALGTMIGIAVALLGIGFALYFPSAAQPPPTSLNSVRSVAR